MVHHAEPPPDSLGAAEEGECDETHTLKGAKSDIKKRATNDGGSYKVRLSVFLCSNVCTFLVAAAIFLGVSMRKSDSSLVPSSASLGSVSELPGFKQKQNETDGNVKLPVVQPTQKQKIGAANKSNKSSPNEMKIEVVSWTPRIVAIENFLNEEESDELLHQAMTQSWWGRTALVGINGNGVPGHTITSKISNLRWHNNPVVENITTRMATTAMVPVENMEELHLLKYDSTQFFRGHLDAHALGGRATSSRHATFFIYLNDVPVENGGATFFPLAVPVKEALNKVSFVKAGIPSHDCSKLAAKDPSVQGPAERKYYLDGFDFVNMEKLKPPFQHRGLWVQPKKGSALIWYSRRPDGQIDPASQHTGCKLHRGNKWAIVNWMHFESRGSCDYRRDRAPCMLSDYQVCSKTGAAPKTCSVFTDHSGQDPISRSYSRNLDQHLDPGPFGNGRPRR